MILPMVLPVNQWYGKFSKLSSLRRTMRRGGERRAHMAEEEKDVGDRNQAYLNTCKAQYHQLLHPKLAMKIRDGTSA